MLEVYVLVPVRRSMAKTFLGIFTLVLGIACFVLSCFSFLFVIPMLILGGLGILLTFYSKKEYEYSYFDGEARFAKVMNKSRRKALGVYSMDEVIQIAPAGDRSVYKYENDSNVKVKDYSSGTEAPCFDMIVNKDGAMTLIKFEPDEKYLDAVAVKYAQKLVRGQ